MKKVTYFLLFLFFQSCQYESKKPNTLEKCDCIVIMQDIHGDFEKIVIKDPDSECYPFKDEMIEHRPDTMKIFGKDSSFFWIQDFFVFNVKKETVSALYESLVAYSSEKGVKFEKGFVFTAQSGENFDFFYASNRKYYVEIFNSFFQNKFFSTEDKDIIEYLELFIHPDIFQEGDSPNVFIRYREINDIVRIRTSSTKSSNVHARRLIYPNMGGEGYHLYNYDLADQILSEDSLHKAFDSNEIFVYRKDQTGEYQLIGSECPEIFEACD